MATSNSSGSAATPKLDSILTLPFVADIKVGPRKKTRCFWNVPKTASYGVACATGAQYARDFVQYLKDDTFWIGSNLIGHFVRDMAAHPTGTKMHGYEVGFWSMLEVLLCRGIVKEIHSDAAQPFQGRADAPTLPADPGHAAALAQIAPSLARFEVGDTALYFCDDEYGEEVRIVGGHMLQTVTSKNGAYLRADGVRIDYRFGYAVNSKGTILFAAPHQLTSLNCKPSHLRLVATRPVFLRAAIA